MYKARIKNLLRKKEKEFAVLCFSVDGRRLFVGYGFICSIMFFGGRSLHLTVDGGRLFVGCKNQDLQN